MGTLTPLRQHHTKQRIYSDVDSDDESDELEEFSDGMPNTGDEDTENEADSEARQAALEKLVPAIDA